MGWDIDRWFSELSRLRDGSLADGFQTSDGTLIFWGIQFHSRPILGNAKVGWEVDLWSEIYVFLECSPRLNSALREVNAIQASLNDWMRSGRRRLLYSMWNAVEVDLDLVTSSEDSSEPSIPCYAVVVSAVILVSFVYQYLTGTADIGRSKAYSRSSLDFRDIYVAIVLFLGAYVWIKFREVACKGVHTREVKDKHGRLIKVVYEPRFKPPRENGTVFQWVYLGQYATQEEASILYQIATFLYNEGQGGSLALADGRLFSIPPMGEGQRSFTAAEKRARLKDEVMRVYNVFEEEKAKAETALLQALVEACEDEATPRQGVDPSESSLLHLAEHQPPLLVSPAEKSGMAIAMVDDQVLECPSQSFGGEHEGFVTSNGHSLGFQEESAPPTSQLPPDTQIGMDINNSNQLNLPQIVQNQQELITYLRQQLQERDAQISVLHNENRIKQQQLEESRIHTSQLESQHFLQQQMQVINEGVPSFDFEVEQSMPQTNHPCRPHGSAFW